MWSRLRVGVITLMLLGIVTAAGWSAQGIQVEKRIRLTAPSGADVYIWDLAPGFEGQGTHQIFLAEDTATGRYPVKLTRITIEIDWDAKTKKVITHSDSVTVHVGLPDPPKPPDPPDPPKPPPDIPPDQFDNIGQQAATWARTLITNPVWREHAPALAASFKTVADRLERGQIGTIGEAAQEVKRLNDAILSNPQARDAWVLWGNRVNEVWKRHWPLTRQEVVLFYRAVATGLEAV